MLKRFLAHRRRALLIMIIGAIGIAGAVWQFGYGRLAIGELSGATAMEILFHCNGPCGLLVHQQSNAQVDRHLMVTESIPRLKDVALNNFDNITTSVVVRGPGALVLYTEPEYEGQCTYKGTGSTDKGFYLGGKTDWSSVRVVDPSPQSGSQLGSITVLPDTVCQNVKLYMDTNFGGSYVVLDRDTADLTNTVHESDMPPARGSGMNDKASSAKIMSGLTAALYRDASFTGPCTTLAENAADLAQLPIGRDAISSVKVPATCPNWEKRVLLYDAANFGGRVVNVENDLANLDQIGFNDKTSSIKVMPGGQAALYDAVNFQGRCSTVTADVSSAGTLTVGDNTVSSVRFGVTCPTVSAAINSDPDAASWAAGRIDLFGRDSGTNELWHRWFSNNQWSAPEMLGGLLGSGPGVASWGSNRLDVFVRGTDGALYQRWSNGSWQPWVKLSANNQLTSDPAAVSWGQGRVDVVARSSSGSLWQMWYDNDRWNGPADLGAPPSGPFVGSPAAASWGSGRLDIFVRGADGALWQRWYNGTNWQPWVKLSANNQLTSDPAAVSWGPTRVDVFAKGNPDGLWHLWFDGTGWKGPENLGGTLTGGPSASSQGANLLDIFARDSSQSNRLSRKSFGASGWSGWSVLP